MSPTDGEVAGECIHGITAAFCDYCKNKTKKQRRGEVGWTKQARQGHRSELPNFPRVVSSFDTKCKWCQGEIAEGEDMVFKVEGEWVCEKCAREYENE